MSYLADVCAFLLEPVGIQKQQVSVSVCVFLALFELVSRVNLAGIPGSAIDLSVPRLVAPLLEFRVPELFPIVSAGPRIDSADFSTRQKFSIPVCLRFWVSSRATKTI